MREWLERTAAGAIVLGIYAAPLVLVAIHTSESDVFGLGLLGDQPAAVEVAVTPARSVDVVFPLRVRPQGSRDQLVLDDAPGPDTNDLAGPPSDASPALLANGAVPAPPPVTPMDGELWPDPKAHTVTVGDARGQGRAGSKGQGKVGAGGGALRRSSRKPGEPKRKGQKKRCSDLVDSIVQIGDFEYVLPRKVVRCYASHFKQWDRVGTAFWEKKDGKIIGVDLVVYGGRHGAVARAAGIRSRDVLLSAGGIRLRSWPAVGLATTQLFTRGRLKVKLVREGEPLTLLYRLGSMRGSERKVRKALGTKKRTRK